MFYWPKKPALCVLGDSVPLGVITVQKSLILFSIVVMAIIMSYPGKAKEWIPYTHASGLIENEVTSIMEKHGRSEIPDHDLLKIAYFITSDDDVIVHWVSQKLPSLDGNPYEKSEAAFEILGKNICCLPKTDWEVSYPRDLLRLKVGNLSDCAILYAAILERLEVPVMLALTPEDAIVLFESNSSQQCIELNHRSWVPVVPQFDLAFDVACQSGLSIYRERQEGEFTLLDVRKEQQRYKPLQMAPPLELYLERGVVYGQRGQYDQAIEQFEAVLEIQENNAAAHNNLGNIYALKAKHSDGESGLENAKKAEKYYDSAAKLDLDDSYTFLNRGIAFYLQGKKGDALIAFRIARFRGKLTFEEACRCMGIDPGDNQYGDIEKLLAEAMNGLVITRAEESQVISDALPLYWKLH
jgi:tetratricopeptide (TPR) repeat protein